MALVSDLTSLALLDLFIIFITSIWINVIGKRLWEYYVKKASNFFFFLAYFDRRWKNITWLINFLCVPCSLVFIDLADSMLDLTIKEKVSFNWVLYTSWWLNDMIFIFVYHSFYDIVKAGSFSMGFGY